MSEHHDVRSWFDELRARMRTEGLGGVGGSVARGMAETLLPEGGEPWVDGEAAEEPLLEFDFGDWPVAARLHLEHELQVRNMEHLWRGAHLIVPTRLEQPVDDVLDELLAAASRPEPEAGSTRWCPTCGGEFVTSVDVCPDCGVPLQDTPPTDLAVGEVDTVRFDLSAWSPDTRLAFAHQLAGGWPLFDGGMTAVANAVGTAAFHRQLPPTLPHGWDGMVLVVRESDADAVGGWIQAVEATVVLALDPSADKLAYDVDDMSDESLTELLEALVEASIPHELSGDGELFVHEADEDAVEAILDRIDFPDELPAQTEDELENPDDGLEAQAALTDLFDSADRIANDPHNADAILELVEGADRMEGMAVPFGFDRTQWDALRSQAGRLRDAVVADERDVDDVVEQARALRDTLHPLV